MVARERRPRRVGKEPASATAQASQASRAQSERSERVSGAAGQRDLRRQQREAIEQARLKAQAAERRRRMLIWGGTAALVVVAFAALVYWLLAPSSANPGAVQSFPIQGQVHIQPGQAHPPYNSVPPTSGWHLGSQVAPAGVSSSPIPDEVQVHNLEHGEIVIQYTCPDGCADVVSALETIVRSYKSKVVLAPRVGLPHRIALTAWGKLAYLDTVDEAFIRKFVADRKDKAPEVFPD